METKKRDTIDINIYIRIMVVVVKYMQHLHKRQINGYKVTRKFDVCKACSVGKARQKNLNKELKEGSSSCGECMQILV
jgi:predicted SprT family Zn-dependent metalloprotease